MYQYIIHFRSSIHKSASIPPYKPVVIPELLSSLVVTEANMSGNMKDSSLKKSLEMLKYGNLFIENGPIENGREVSWKIRSQSTYVDIYKVTISPHILMTYRNRDKYKNYDYKCDCPDFKAILFQISISYTLMKI